MTTVPVLIPVTTPVVASTVALEVLLLLQVPPETEELKVVVYEIQTLVTPVITGRLFTVIVAAVIEAQPAADVTM